MIKYLKVNDEYKNVGDYCHTASVKEKVYRGKVTINNRTYQKYFKTALEAAKFVDLTLIKNGLPQINNTFNKL